MGGMIFLSVGFFIGMMGMGGMSSMMAIIFLEVEPVETGQLVG